MVTLRKSKNKQQMASMGCWRGRVAQNHDYLPVRYPVRGFSVFQAEVEGMKRVVAALVPEEMVEA